MKIWSFYALLSAVFAALTAIFAKMGLKGVPGNLATAIRTIVVLALAWAIVAATGEWKFLRQVGRQQLLFLVLSGMATGFSWICYFKALENGPVSKVAPVDKLSVVIAMALAYVFLREPMDWKTGIGGALIVLGAILMIR